MYTDLPQIENELDEFLVDFGFQLVDLKIAGNRGGRVYRLFVERIDEGPVTIDNCGALAPQVALFLEMKGVFTEQCSLEVGSPGVDRVLKRERDFERFLGCQVKVKYINDRAKVTVCGELASFADDVLIIVPEASEDGRTMAINRQDLEKVTLVPKLEI